MIRRSLAAALACVAAVLGAPVLTGPAQAAPDEVQVVDVPPGQRGTPRNTFLHGFTDTQGLLVTQEQNPPAGSTYGASVDLLVAADGSTSSPGVDVRDVVGDRAITQVGSASVSSVVLPDGVPTTVAVPTGHRLLDYTGDGLLLVTAAAGAQSLVLLPWTGGEPVPVVGVPDAMTFDVLWPSVRDRTGAVLRAYPVDSSPAFNLYVSTSARRAWPLTASDRCEARRGTTWALGESAIAWQTPDPEARQICTMPRPAVDAETLAPAQARPAVDLPVGNQWYDVQLLPVADDVVVSRRSVGPQTDAPVYRVAADGTATKLLDWGHSVRPAGGGSVVAVGGRSASSASIVRLDLNTGVETVLAPITPVPATTTSLAVDDGRVVAMDNSAQGAAVVQRSLSFGGVPRAGEPETLAAGVTDQVAAGEGQTAWQKHGAWTVRDADGTTTSSMLANGGPAPAGTRALSGRWILYDSGHVLDHSQNALAAHEAASWSRGDRALVDGVLYLRGADVSSALQGRVIMRDLATGQAASLHIPGCLSAGGVQAAGKWLMTRCRLSEDRVGYVVADRTGATPTFTLLDAAPVLLGNGFAVRHGEDASLDWRPLDDPSAGWEPLAPAGSAQLVAVSNGNEATIAWSNGVSTRAALLPVATTANPPRPTGVTAPNAPQATVTPYDKTIAVKWASASPAEQLTGYQILLGSGSPTDLRTDATSKTFSPVTNGTSFKVTLSAVNIAGRATTTLTAVPLAPPATPTNVRATVDRINSRVQVTWDWSAGPRTEALTGFDVGAGGFVGASGLAPGVRSASFVMPHAWTGPVTVTARGSLQQAEGESAALTFPGLDTKAPTSSVGGVPEVTKRSSLTLAVAGRDERALKGVDVRTRSAAFGQRLGAWTRPSGWQGRQPGSLTVTGLRPGGTYCYSSRAHDAAGNVSAWSPARCTSVVLDDRAFARAGRWSSVTGPGFYKNTASRTSAHYAELRRPSVPVSSVWLVATTCPTCGSVTVFSGGGSFRSVSLRSPTRRPHALVKVPWSMRTGGALKIVTWPRWGTVTIDGVAVRSY